MHIICLDFISSECKYIETYPRITSDYNIIGIGLTHNYTPCSFKFVNRSLFPCEPRVSIKLIFFTFAPQVIVQFAGLYADRRVGLYLIKRVDLRGYACYLDLH